MKKNKGAPVKSRATSRRSTAKRPATKKNPPGHAAKSTARPTKPKPSRAGQRSSARRELYPAIEPFRHGYLRVSDVHEIYYEESGNPAGKPAVPATPGARRGKGRGKPPPSQ